MFKQIFKFRIFHNSNVLSGSVVRKSTDVSTSFQCQFNFHHIRWLSTESEKVKKWDLCSGICLERHPVILKPMTDLEAKYQKQLRDIEFENSMLSKHELRIKLEETQKNLQQKQKEINIDIISTQTAQDFEDLAKQELDSFKFAPTITEADKNNKTNSLDRKLDKNLVLLIERKLGNNLYWLPPYGIRYDGETLRQTAERVLQDFCGPKISAKFYGNAPIGFYKYTYPKSIRQNGQHGAKIFFFLAKYTGGEILSDIKHQWLDQAELKETLPAGIHKSMSQFLIHS